MGSSDGEYSPSDNEDVVAAESNRHSQNAAGGMDNIEDDDVIMEEDESDLSAQASYTLEYLLKLEELHQLMTDSNDAVKLRKVADILVQSGKASLCSSTQTLKVDLCALQRKTIWELTD